MQMMPKPFIEDLNYFFGSQVSSEQYEDCCRYESEPLGNTIEANEIVRLDSGIFLNSDRMDSLANSSYSKMDDDFVRSILTVEGERDAINWADSKVAGCQIVEKKLQSVESDGITNKSSCADVEKRDCKNIGCLPENCRRKDTPEKIGVILIAEIPRSQNNVDRTDCKDVGCLPENYRRKDIQEKIGVTLLAEIPQPQTERQSAAQGLVTELCVFGSVAAVQSTATVTAVPRAAKRPLNADLAVAPKRGRGNRGAHVRERPDMQQAARDGAAHWLQQLRRVRADWAAAAQANPSFGAEHRAQADAAAARVKAKLECLLRTLQLAAHAGLITPLPAPAQPAERDGSGGAAGFFGWVGFVVHAGRAAEFRAAVAGLFPAAFREETVRETFRRAGLVPAGWRWADGWCGAAPFVPVVRSSGPPAPRRPQPGSARRPG